MATVTHKSQPGVKKSAVPLEGTKHLYRTTKLLWPTEVEEVLADIVSEAPCLHVYAGFSQLGNCRLDTNPDVIPHIRADAARLPFRSDSWDTVLCDPPYAGQFQWNHDVLSELSRVASRRIVFQHWFIPANPHGLYKKDNRFELLDVFVWQPRTYFGRVQVISVFDKRHNEGGSAW